MFHSVWNKQRIFDIKSYVVHPVFILAVHKSTWYQHLFPKYKNPPFLCLINHYGMNVFFLFICNNAIRF